MGKRNQPQAAVWSREAFEPAQWVTVFIPDAHREVQRRKIMVETGATQLGSSADPVALADCQRRQVRVGSAQATPVNDGDRKHASNVAGERHFTGIGGMNWRADGYADVYAPVPAIAADWFEGAKRWPGDRRFETWTLADWKHNGGTDGESNQERIDFDPSPPPTARSGYPEQASK